jgi:hypothetical protein
MVSDKSLVPGELLDLPFSGYYNSHNSLIVLGKRFSLEAMIFEYCHWVMCSVTVRVTPPGTHPVEAIFKPYRSPSKRLKNFLDFRSNTSSPL